MFPGARIAGNIEYVSGWFIKSARYMADRPVRAALVATKSVVQGEQVANIWSPIYDLGCHIDFAHDTFRWTNESTEAATVFVVIVGFSKQGGPKHTFRYTTLDSKAALETVPQLNIYLKEAPDVFV